MLTVKDAVRNAASLAIEIHVTKLAQRSYDVAISVLVSVESLAHPNVVFATKQKSPKFFSVMKMKLMPDLYSYKTAIISLK